MLFRSDGLGKYGDTPNPSAHFTSATLDPATKGNYQTTSDAMKGNHWDSPWGGTELTVEDGGDVVLRKDLINPDKRGVTTANDIFTYLQSKGKTPPDLRGLSNSQKLEVLTDALREATGASTDFEALKDLASPTKTILPKIIMTQILEPYHVSLGQTIWGKWIFPPMIM